MGLRSSSDWQGQTTRSQFGAPTELTPKQQDMAGATSPLAFNQPNQPTPKEPKEEGTTAGQRAQFEGQTKQQEQAQQTPQARQQQQASPVSQAVEAAASKLGNFAHSLRGYVNQFLRGGAEAVGLGQVKEDWVLDPAAHTSTLRISDASQDIEPVLQQKMREQERIKGALSPFAQEVGGKLMGKDFAQVMKEQFGDDPQIAQMLQMVDSLQMLDQQGMGGSPEARALESQLQQMDQFGMVSDLREAMQTYNQMMGLGTSGKTTKWYGDEKDTGYSVLDLVALDQNTMRTEIEKAQKFSSGLFGGDFEENLQKKFDTESAEGKRAAAQKSAIHSELYNAFQSYADQMGDKFTGARDTIDKEFNAATTALWTEMQLTPEGREAAAWFQGMQGGEFKDLLYKALSDPNSGLAKEQRDVIANFIGRAGSGSTEGQLYTWLDSLGRTGKVPISYTDANGAPQTQLVEPTTEQKMQIAQMMGDYTLDTAEKTQKLTQLVREIGIDQATSVGTQVDNAISAVSKTGSTAAALVIFNRGMANSLQTFANSKTEDFVGQILAQQGEFSLEQWEALKQKRNSTDPAEAFDARKEISEFVVRTLNNLTPEQANVLKDSFKTKQDDERQKFDATLKQWNDDYTKKVQALDSTDKELQGKIQELTTQKTNLPQQMVTRAVRYAQEGFPQRVSNVLQQISANPWIQNNVPTQYRISLAYSLSAQERLSRIQEMSPALYNAIAKNRIDVSINPVDLVTRGDYASLTSLNNNLEAIMKELASGSSSYIDAVTGDISDAWQRIQAGNSAGIPPSLLSAANIYGQLDSTLSQLNDNVNQSAEMRKKLNADYQTYQDLVKSLDIPSFAPDEILEQVMNFARGTEMAGKIPETGKFPTIDWSTVKDKGEDILVDILGYGGADITTEEGRKKAGLAISDNLQKMGVRVDAIAWKNGMPYISMQMGKDGKEAQYVPLTNDLIGKLNAGVVPQQIASPELAQVGAWEWTPAAEGEIAGLEKIPEIKAEAIGPDITRTHGSKTIPQLIQEFGDIPALAPLKAGLEAGVIPFNAPIKDYVGAVSALLNTDPTSLSSINNTVKNLIKLGTTDQLMRPLKELNNVKNILEKGLQQGFGVGKDTKKAVKLAKVLAPGAKKIKSKAKEKIKKFGKWVSGE